MKTIKKASIQPGFVAPKLMRMAGALLAVIEIDTLGPAAHGALSPEETERMRPMGPRRRPGFMAGRIAVKMLAVAGGASMKKPLCDFNTVEPGSDAPNFPVAGRAAMRHCSISHDKRFAVAAAAGAPVGVDVEEIGERVMRVRRYYMDAEEMLLADRSRLGAAPASLRAWSVKEAVSKAMTAHLPKTWKRVIMISIGSAKSRFLLDGREYTACHREIQGHLVTVVVL
jgi:4'-phosphopantetheinyl transferase EntD